MMIVRYAKDEDCHVIYNLHIASIKHYCAAVYSKSAITSWIKLKTPDEYKNNQPNKLVIVAEEGDEILGFGILNVEKKSIESLYIKPHMAGKGIGAILIKKIEAIAQIKDIGELTLYSTINSVSFYHHMGYHGEDNTVFKLSTGDELDSVFMMKELSLEQG